MRLVIFTSFREVAMEVWTACCIFVIEGGTSLTNVLNSLTNTRVLIIALLTLLLSQLLIIIPGRTSVDLSVLIRARPRFENLQAAVDISKYRRPR